MKFTIDRGPMLAALGAVHAIVARRSTIPILTNLKLAADADRLTITATDMDMEGSVTVAARVDRPGATTVNADKLNAICQSLPEGADLTLDVGDAAALTAGRFRSKLGVLGADQFPTFRDAADLQAFTLPAADLARLIDVGAACMDTETNLRPYISCAYLHTTGGKLRVASTEGHKFVYIERASPAGAQGPLVLPEGAMLPPKLIATLRRLIGNVPDDAPCAIRVNGERLEAQIGPTVLRSKLVDQTGGRYPDYSRFFRGERFGQLVADTDLLMGCLKRTLILASDKDNSLKIILGDGKLSVRSGNPNFGEGADDEFDVDWTCADAEYEFWVSGTWLLDMLAFVRTESVTIDIPPGLAPMQIGETGGDSDWRGVLTPLNKR